MSILDKYLRKLKVEKEEELTPEEQVTFQSYRRILSGENVSVDAIKEFCQSQIKLIEQRFIEEKGRSENDVYYKACLHVYLTLLRAIEAPEQEREALERHLNQLINEV